MKRCPECRRDYYDDSLAYCLDDGTPLLEGPASGNESATAILDPAGFANEVSKARGNPGVLDKEYTARGMNRQKAFAVAAVVLILIAIGSAVYRYSGFFSVRANRFTLSENLKFTRLTTGQMRDIKISPDGKYVAYTTDPNSGKVSIRLRQVATTTDVEIVTPTVGWTDALSFTADGDYLYYVHYDNFGVNRESTIYRVPVLGGTASKVVDKLVYTDTASSPDGRSLAYIGTDVGKQESYLLLAKADGSDERILSKVDDVTGFGRGLAWSPDGKSIAFCDVILDQGKKHLKIFAISIDDGSRQQLSDQNWARVGGIVWLADRDLIMSGAEESAQPELAVPSQLWLLVPNEIPRRITNDVNGFPKVSATAKGDALLAVTVKQIGNLWTMPDSDSANAVQVPNSGDVLFVNWTPAGSFVYTSRASDIWTMNSDGTNQMQLTNDQGRNIHATMTADGRYIVFHSNREDGTNHIFRMDADGRNQVQLTNGRGESGGRLSPDGKWVYFASFNGANEPSSICRVSIEGGEPMYIAQVASESPTFDISPRTGLIAYRQSGKGQEKNGGNISIIPPEGGQPLKILTLPPTAAGMFRWTPDERAIAFQDTRNGGTNIWALSRDKGEARPLTDFKTENISFSFAWSVDGKKLAVIRSTRVTDAVLVTEIK